MLYTHRKTSHISSQSLSDFVNKKPIHISVAAALDRGKVREINEDNYYRSDRDPEAKSSDGQLYFIVDGVGGNGEGYLAGQIACEKMPQYFFHPSKVGLPLATRMLDAIDGVHREIFLAGASSVAFEGGGLIHVLTEVKLHILPMMLRREIEKAKVCQCVLTVPLWNSLR